jgi:hypothetical protein
MPCSPNLSRIAAIAALVLLGPGAAHAGQLTVDFDFSGSSVAILGGFINIPPDGAITTASGQIVVQAPGLLTAQAGSARLANLALAGTFAKNSLGVNIAGAIGATQPASALGNLSTGLDHLVFNPFQMNFTGFASCTSTGPGCGVLSLPATFTGPQVFTIASLAVGNLGIDGGAFLNGTFAFTIGGFTAVLNLVGNEVARTWVPEPNSFGLLGLGLAGLAAARRHLRRQT